MGSKKIEKTSISAVLVTQGKHKFYTLTMFSDVLARTCFVTTREEDQEKGFQRVLDQKRAQQIADYIDTGFGTIPCSIVLSAQEDAEFTYDSKAKTVEFKLTDKSFLVLDGQHRVWGFALAKEKLRVPVVIYNSLSRQDETQLFIDINTKQKPVSNELLLDIKRLAETETSSERVMGDIFDLFNESTNSPLIGLLSSYERASTKISRVTFNSSIKPILPVLSGKNPDDVYIILSAYIGSVIDVCAAHKIKLPITVPKVFKAVLAIFPDIAMKVKDKNAGAYTAANFYSELDPIFQNVTPGLFKQSGTAVKPLIESLRKLIKNSFTL